MLGLDTFSRQHSNCLERSDISTVGLRVSQADLPFQAVVPQKEVFGLSDFK